MAMNPPTAMTAIVCMAAGMFEGFTLEVLD